VNAGESPERECMAADTALWVPAYVGLGSNLDDPPDQLRRALAELGRLPHTRLVAHSGFFRNPPLGPVPQPPFVNAAAALVTQLTARALLAALKGIEDAHGRVRDANTRWGPRALDLDLLMFGQSRCAEDGLTLPHPGIAERNFVLFPLQEIAPALTIPGHGRIGELLDRLDCSTLERID